MGAYANPFDPDKLLWNGCPCGQHRSILEHQLAMAGADSDSRFACEEIVPGNSSSSNSNNSASAQQGQQPIREQSNAATSRNPFNKNHAAANCFDPSCTLPQCVALRNSQAKAQPFKDIAEPTGEDMANSGI